MKTTSLVLSLSLILNIGLVAVAVINRSKISLVDVSPARETASDGTTNTHNSTLEAAQLWREFPRDNIDELLSQMGATGFSPAEQIATINAYFEAKLRELAHIEATVARPYWKGFGFMLENRQEQAERMRKLNELFSIQRQYLLSPELFEANPDLIAESQRQFGHFPVEKLRQLLLIQSDEQAANARREQQTAATTSKPGEARYAFDEKSFREAEAQRLAKIQAVLTPEEFAAYELRNGPTATMLRSRLEHFRPTEEEYKALYAIQKSLETARLNQPSSREAQLAAAKEAEELAAAALGPERAADYAELSKNHGDKLPRLMARLNLPLATLGAITAVRDHTNAQAKAIQSNQQLTAAERSAQLAALATEARTQLTHTLGAEGFDAYHDLKGEWLRNLAPKPGGP